MPILRKKWYFLFPNMISLLYTPSAEDRILGENIPLFSQSFISNIIVSPQI